MEFYLISLLQDSTDGCTIKSKLTSYERKLKRNSKEKLAVQVLLTKSEDEVTGSMKTLLQDRFEQCLADLERWTEENSTPLMDPISRCIFSEPVILKESKKTYEKETINQWLAQKNTDPLTNERLTDTSYISNHQVKSMVSEFIEKFVKGAKDMLHFFVRLYPILVSFSDQERMKGWISRMEVIIEDSREFSKNRVVLLEHVSVFYNTVGGDGEKREVFEILLEKYMKKEKHVESIPLLENLIHLWGDDPKKRQHFIFHFLRCHQHLCNHSEVVRSLIKYSKYMDVKTEQNTLLRYQCQLYPKSVKLLEYMSTRNIFSSQLSAHFLYKIAELKKNDRSSIERRIDLLESCLKRFPDHHLGRTDVLELVRGPSGHSEKCLEHSRYLHDWYQLRRRKKDMLRLYISCDPNDDVCREKIIDYELSDERYEEAKLLIQQGGSNFGGLGVQCLMKHMSSNSKVMNTMKEMLTLLVKEMSEHRIQSKYGIEDTHELVRKMGFEIVHPGIIRIFHDDNTDEDKKDNNDQRRSRRRKKKMSRSREADIIEVLSSLSITRLDISGLSMRKTERLDLKKTMQSIQFDTLLMSKCQLGENHLDWLRVMDPTLLRVVDLSKNSIGVSGLDVVTKWLRKSIRLEVVDFADNNFAAVKGSKKKNGNSNNYINHLVGLLFEVETIKKLSVSGNKMDFLDLVWLVEVGNCHKALKYIDVSRNSVTRKEARTIASIGKRCFVKIDIVMENIRVKE